MKQKKITIIAIAVVISLLVVVLFIVSPKKQEQNRAQKETSISDLKYEIGATGKEELYETQKDEKGKEVIQIKKELLYKVALAGILKNEKPIYEELDKILQEKPMDNGIWISQEARKDILSMLQTYLKNNYKIDENRILAIRKTKFARGKPI